MNLIYFLYWLISRLFTLFTIDLNQIIQISKLLIYPKMYFTFFYFKLLFLFCFFDFNFSKKFFYFFKKFIYKLIIN